MREGRDSCRRSGMCERSLLIVVPNDVRLSRNIPAQPRRPRLLAVTVALQHCRLDLVEFTNRDGLQLLGLVQCRMRFTFLCHENFLSIMFGPRGFEAPTRAS